MINGTQGMLAIGTLALLRAERLARTADVTGAMSLEALKGSPRPFDPAILEARPHPGAIDAGRHLRALLADSPNVESHADCDEVQDAYSLRCMPQVHGSGRDALGFVRAVLEIELNSATDNPLVLPDGRIESGGNFHGQPVAAALDVAALAVTDLASMAERRLAQLVDPALSRGLPPFLASDSGLNSGFMMAQVTAAALVKGRSSEIQAVWETRIVVARRRSQYLNDRLFFSTRVIVASSAGNNATDAIWSCPVSVEANTNAETRLGSVSCRSV